MALTKGTHSRLMPRGCVQGLGPIGQRKEFQLGRRLSISLALLAIGVGLLVAAGFASPASSNSAKAGAHVAKGGTLRVDQRSDFDFIDPALAYFSHSWQVEYATQCKLLNFPDKEATAGGTRIVPEVATALPAVSKNGKTYAFNRDLQPKMSSPATTFIEDIKGADAVLSGKAASASGIKVLSPRKLQI